MIARRIRHLREQQKLTQADLAKQLGITRSGVNAWEMGISIPSTAYVVELANFFQVSTDYILGVENSVSIPADGLTEADIHIVHSLIEHLKSKNDQNNT